MQIETIHILANGKQVLYDRAELVSIETSLKAPAEILAILEKVK